VALQQAIGPRFAHFRDALTADALAYKAAHPAGSADVKITATMREDLWAQLHEHGVTMDRRTFDQMAPTVDRWLHNEIVRYELGPDAAFRLLLQTDTTVRTALDLARRARSARELVLHPAPPADSRSAATERAGDRSDDRAQIR
jgi:hypothetical protein